MKPTILLLILYSALYSLAQPSEKKYPPFTIGDKLPPLTVTDVLNNKAGFILMNDYKDKLLILDFMATSCLGCIRSLPHFDSLQQKYNNKLQFVLVTEEKKERVAAFLKNNKWGKSIRFPFVIADTVLRSWFPHEFISHMVWIYRGMVVAITRSDYVTAAHIETVLDGKIPGLPVKNDFVTFDFTRPLLSFLPQPENEKPTLQFYTGIRSNIPGILRSYRRLAHTAASTQRILFINYTLTEIYLKTYGIPLSYPKKWIEVRAGDKARFIFDPSASFEEDWRQKNTWCYEAVFPLSFSQQQCMNYIRSDLDRWFDLSTRIEKRDTSYLIITQNNFSNVPK